MNVLFDISIIALGYKGEKYRTGLYRVVENLAIELLNRKKDVDICFAAPLSAYTVGKAYQHIRKNVVFQGAKLLCNPSFERYFCPKIMFFFYPPFSHNDLKKINIYHSPFHGIPFRIIRNKSIKKFITIHDLAPILFPKGISVKGRLYFKHGILGSINEETSVFTVSESAKNDLCNYHKNLSPQRIQVVHLSASESLSPVTDASVINRTKKKYGIPEGNYVLGLSTIEPKKNIKTTLKAFAHLITQQKISDLNLILAGAGGWGQKEVSSAIKELKYIQDRVVFTGFIEEDDLPAVYSGAMMFIFPSIYEGFGLPPLEAMKCGVPVITSNAASLPEVVGNAGITNNCYDADGFSQSMLEIYRDEELRARMKIQSLERSKKFSWEMTVDKILNGYRERLG